MAHAWKILGFICPIGWFPHVVRFKIRRECSWGGSNSACWIVCLIPATGHHARFRVIALLSEDFRCGGYPLLDPSARAHTYIIVYVSATCMFTQHVMIPGYLNNGFLEDRF